MSVTKVALPGSSLILLFRAFISLFSALILYLYSVLSCWLLFSYANVNVGMAMIANAAMMFLIVIICSFFC